MNRITAGVLIAVAVLALNAGMLREAFAQDSTMRLGATATVTSEANSRSSRVLSLLLVLQALNRAP